MLSGGKIELMPGAFFDVTGIFEDLTGPDRTLRNRVPSPTHSPALSSSHAVALARHPSLSNTTTLTEKINSENSLQSLGSTMIVPNEGTVFGRDPLLVQQPQPQPQPQPTIQLSPFRRPSSRVIPSRSSQVPLLFLIPLFLD